MASNQHEDDDEFPQLSANALASLQEFNLEKDTREKQFEDLKAQAENDFENGQLSMDIFAEDWNASQFWYQDETALILAKQLLEGATNESCIAVVSAPSVYIQLRNLISSGAYPARPSTYLLEFDKRFEVFKDQFVYYDFEHPLRLPAELKGKFDRIICDPPFLSDDCQTKAALTVRYLAKTWMSPEQAKQSRTAQDLQPATLRFISCTGERMEHLIMKLYGKIGVRTTSFDPEHNKGLSNEFRCYANFESDKWHWRASD